MDKDRLILGIIGGSGIYDIDGVENSKWVKVTTPYGDPSDEIYTGSLNGINLAFLPAWSGSSLFTKHRAVSSECLCNEIAWGYGHSLYFCLQ